MSPAPVSGSGILFHVLLALLAILVAARLLGIAFRRIGQPPVIGEVVAGILLGPSLLGRVWPEASSFLLPASVAPYLQVIAQVGVILYMFVVGLELDPREIARRPHVTLAVSGAGILVPFVLGVALATALYPAYAGAHVPFAAFAVFVGVALSVTAFPVLARILTDRGMQHTALGALALGCAAIDDVSAWCLLALATGVATAREGDALRTFVLTAGFLVLFLFGLRPVLERLARRVESAGRGLSIEAMTAVFAMLLGTALLTEWIGIHALFGAFLLGVAIPHDSVLAREMRLRLHDVVAVLLLPAFFAFSGLRTQIGLVSSGGEWLLCLGIVLVASVGKFGGTTVAGRAVGLPWRTAASLGVLMNTRGLVELIVLNIGLDLGVISPALFTMLVLMALATTFATSPILAGIGRPDVERVLRRGWLHAAGALVLVAGYLLMLLGVVAAFCIIPFLPMTLIATGMRLAHYGWQLPERES